MVKLPKMELNGVQFVQNPLFLPGGWPLRMDRKNVYDSALALAFVVVSLSFTSQLTNAKLDRVCEKPAGLCLYSHSALLAAVVKQLPYR